MNRKDRLTQDAHVRRTGAPSLTLLQDQLQKLAAENQQMRNVLLAILKEQGRVRVMRATIAGLSDGDSIQTRELVDAYVFQYVATNMVAGPRGVENGKPVDAPKESA